MKKLYLFIAALVALSVSAIAKPASTIKKPMLGRELQL